MANKVYSYIRVSTAKQSLERQKKNINAYLKGESSIMFEDEYTGTTMHRPNFEKLCKAVDKDVQNGNHVTIIFDSVSRMSRNAAEGVEQYFKWLNNGVSLVFLNEHYIDTDTYKAAEQSSIPETGNEIADIYINATNQVLMLLAKRQIEIAFAQSEKEVADLKIRTKQGMATKGAAEKISKARKNQSITTAAEIDIKIKALKELKMFGGHDNQSKFANARKVSRMTVYRYVQDIKEELEQGTSQDELLKRYKAELKVLKEHKKENK